ncbi:MAG TPA: hypothetical protein VHL58_06060 [Thermoanaerobaculia bacterium]|nr:hypothetical protein [Thermoanaerobaculia bacterium]
MIRTKWTIRMRILAAVVSVAVLAIPACRDANKEGTTATAASGAAPAATGDHSNEEFCKTIALQGEQFGRFTKLDIFDMAGRAKYFADQKNLNATLVKTAPASLKSDVALQTRNANAMIDAQLAKDSAGIKATAAVLSSPENLTASRHMTDYCGVTISR